MILTVRHQAAKDRIRIYGCVATMKETWEKRIDRAEQLARDSYEGLVLNGVVDETYLRGQKI